MCSMLPLQERNSKELINNIDNNNTRNRSFGSELIKGH